MEQNTTLENAKTLGQRLNLSKRQIFRLNSSGKLPRPVRICGTVRWISEEISQWILSGCPDRREFEARTQKAGRLTDGLEEAVQLILMALRIPENNSGLRQACYDQLEQVLRQHYARGE